MVMKWMRDDVTAARHEPAIKGLQGRNRMVTPCGDLVRFRPFPCVFPTGRAHGLRKGVTG